MVDVEKTDSNKTPLALAALMFFSPFIQHGLTSGSFSMNEQEKDFVSGYVKLGYLNLLFLLIAVGTGVGNYLANSHLLEIISTISIGILLIFLLIGTICILANISLHIQKSFQIDYYDIGDNRQHVILKYLPLYNVYLRYKLHAFGAPNRWLKESLLRWTIAIVLMFTTSPYLVGTRIVLLILRVATLMGGIDFLHIEAKKQINYLFEKNPEELRGYITGSLIYLGRAIKNIFRKISIPVSLPSCIHEEQIVYGYLYNIPETPSIRVEYLIGLGLGIGYCLLVRPDFTAWITYIPLVLIVGRYLIMVFAWKHLPNLPLAREIRLLLTLLIIQPFRFLFTRHHHDAV